MLKAVFSNKDLSLFDEYFDCVKDLVNDRNILRLCEWNTMEEMDYILKEVPEVVQYLRNMSPVWRDLQTGKRAYIL